MADYLVRRGGFWRFVRRVPKEYADFDKRGIVQQSTKIRVADDPKKMRARKVAGDMNSALERYWRDLTESDQAQAVRDYEAARNAARKLRLPGPIDDATKRTIAELLDRIEKLSGNRAVHRGASTRVEQSQARRSMAGDACQLCLSGDRERAS